ncbi:MAG: glutamine-hydrolyzing GMP synthase subunit GuaA, partial [Clostridia bacterium]|nr:glutamine-hydrolyzing GMP synthase subunit GuaA [Clostridia bacterium]
MDSNKRPDSMQRITTAALADAFIEEQIAALREQIGDKKVLLALSGGVDSSVVAALLIKAVGKQLVCVHVNHGLLRKGEPEQVVKVFRDEMNANLIYVDAVDRFLDKLVGVADPEQKRKIIGAEFIRVFEEEARKLDDIDFLAQGTIYPDILESVGVKAHHNVGGLPEDLQFELVEPIKLLYKDEVRVVG